MSDTQSSQPRYTRHELTVYDLPDNGSVTLPNAIVLAEGVWHDSLGPVPVTYLFPTYVGMKQPIHIATQNQIYCPKLIVEE